MLRLKALEIYLRTIPKSSTLVKFDAHDAACSGQRQGVFRPLKDDPPIPLGVESGPDGDPDGLVVAYVFTRRLLG